MDALLDSEGDGLRRSLERDARGDVEKRLVERQALDQRRELVKDREHLLRHFLVAAHARWNAHRVGTAAQRFAHRHRRVHAEAAHLVTGRGYDAPAPRAADDDGFALQLWIVVLFDGRVKRIHVHMQDGACAVHDGRIISLR